MITPLEGHFGAQDRLDAHLLGGLHESDRTVEPVVVGQRQRGHSQLGRADYQRFRGRDAIQ